jgi:hypothetical protein
VEEEAWLYVNPRICPFAVPDLISKDEDRAILEVDKFGQIWEVSWQIEWKIMFWWIWDLPGINLTTTPSVGI